MATPSFLDPQWPPGRSERLAGNHQRRACPAVFALGLWLTGHFLTLAVATPLWVSVVFSGSRNITTLSMCFIFYCLRIRNLCKILFFQLLEFLLKREFLRPPIHQIVYSRMSMKGKQWGAVATGDSVPKTVSGQSPSTGPTAPQAALAGPPPCPVPEPHSDPPWPPRHGVHRLVELGAPTF